MIEGLKINSIKFKFPEGKLIMFFSWEDDKFRKSTMIKSRVLVPVEAVSKYGDKSINRKLSLGKPLYCSLDTPMKDFVPVEVDFSNQDNEDFVKMYYRRKLEGVLSKHPELMFCQSDYMSDIQIGKLNTKAGMREVCYKGHTIGLWEMELFTLKIRIDHFNNCPVIIVSNDRPKLITDMSLDEFFKLDDSDSPFEQSGNGITPEMVSDVVYGKKCHDDQGNPYVQKRVENLKYLHRKGKAPKYCETKAVMNKALKRVFGLEHDNKPRSRDSKYVSYMESITEFKDMYLCGDDIKAVFNGIENDFTMLNPMQTGIISQTKSVLSFANGTKNLRPQFGINYGPAKACPKTDVKLLCIYPQSNRSICSLIIKAFRDGKYSDVVELKDTGGYSQKIMGHYLGCTVTYAEREMQIMYSNTENPLEEIMETLKGDAFRNMNSNSTYVAIYMSPIPKYASSPQRKEVYYKVKERLLKMGIISQCIELDKMLLAINKDKQSKKMNFVYSMQNMSVAVCAKLGGKPWLLDVEKKDDLIVGVGAFRTEDNMQYVGTTFAFDNTGAFRNYQFFSKSELRELVGSIYEAIIGYTKVNDNPRRLIIHYYKKISRKNEMQPIEDMLHQLNLDIPIYVVSINKTLSADYVVFDPQSTYNDFGGKVIRCLMPQSGTYVNLGMTKDGRQQFLLCNNTKYANQKFNPMDGFPFPVKLSIAYSGTDGDIDEKVIHELVEQVHQFSKIYYKSVKQQGLPVTVSYPSMIAEIMPHFDNKQLYEKADNLWFL